jgi:hypothetical protein
MSAFTFSPRVRADDAKAQCIDAYENGQRSRKAGSLMQAKSEFTYCSSDACPQGMHEDCAKWLSEVSAAIPTGVFHVTDGDGKELAGVRVSVDGGDAELLSGRAFALDPGEHELTFECDGYRTLTERVTLAAGERLAPEFVLEPLPSKPDEFAVAKTSPADGAAPPAREQRNLVPTLVGLGVGVVGTASFITFGLMARAGDRSLGSCIPDCSAERVDAVRQDYLLSNVSLGIAGAGFLGAGLSLLLLEPAPASTPASRASVRLRVGPVSYLTGEF